MPRTLSLLADLTDREPMAGSDDTWEHDTWDVTLRFGNTDYATKFHTGTGHRVHGRPQPPTLGTVLESLATDASFIRDANDVSDFARELGMPDTPDELRQMIATFEATKKQTDMLERLFGRELFWDTIVYGAPDDGWSSITTDTLEF
jgi:hypothetical protein